MKILTNVKIVNVIEDRKTRVCTIETNHPELTSFEATKPVHHGWVIGYFDGEMKESYSLLIDNGSVDGITPSGSEYEAKWREVFSV